MPKVVVICGRCYDAVEGTQTKEYTGGFFKTQEGTPWHKYAKNGELIICDDCMQADAGFQRDYEIVPIDTRG